MPGRVTIGRFAVTGMVADRHAWTLAELQTLPQADQITRHICVEGWSAIGKWGGILAATSPRSHSSDGRLGPPRGYRYAVPYLVSTRMPSSFSMGVGNTPPMQTMTMSLSMEMDSPSRSSRT